MERVKSEPEHENIEKITFKMQIPPSPKIFETSDVGISPETVRQPDTPGRGEQAKCNFSELFLEYPQTSKFTNVDKKRIRLIDWI